MFKLIDTKENYLKYIRAHEKGIKMIANNNTPRLSKNEEQKLYNTVYGAKELTPEQTAKEAIKTIKNLNPETYCPSYILLSYSLSGILFYGLASIGPKLVSPVFGKYSWVVGALLCGTTKLIIDRVIGKTWIDPSIKKIEKFHNDLIQQQQNKTLFKKDDINFIDKLPALDKIKQQLNIMADKVYIDQQRNIAGLLTHKTCYHMVFQGNSGTGKTITAKALATNLFKMGILREDKCKVADKSTFYSNLIGTTGVITENVLNEASGGLLFIDEAYTLNKQEINISGQQVGSDVIEKLLTLLEDRKDDTIVIFAGYPDAMQKFKKANPGLASRIPYTIEFDDYNNNQLLEIFTYFCEQYNYTLSDNSRLLAKQLLSNIKSSQGKSFANGRTVRNFFERAIHEQSVRLAHEKKIQNDSMAVSTSNEILSDNKNNTSLETKTNINSNEDSTLEEKTNINTNVASELEEKTNINTNVDSTLEKNIPDFPMEKLQELIESDLKNSYDFLA